MSREESAQTGRALVRRPQLSPGAKSAVQWAAPPAVTGAALLATPVLSHVLSTTPHILAEGGAIGLGAGVAAAGWAETFQVGNRDSGSRAMAAITTGAVGTGGMASAIAVATGATTGGVVGTGIGIGVVTGLTLGMAIGIRADARVRSVPSAVRARRLGIVARVTASAGAIAGTADVVQHFGATHLASPAALSAIAAGGLAAGAASGLASRIAGRGVSS